MFRTRVLSKGQAGRIQKAEGIYMLSNDHLIRS